MMPSVPTKLIELNWQGSDWTLSLTISAALLAALSAMAVLILVWRFFIGGFGISEFEIDQAEIGVGSSKFKFKPNNTDKQVAYAIWVELSTRKIGLPIDLDHDVVAEVYDSWYNYFSVTRELIKGISASQVKRSSTQAIVRLSIEVLNEGLRPHLTQWQARFRTWYNRELKRYEESSGADILDPQQIQAKFPQFAELRADMERVNGALMRYRSKMKELVLQD